MTQPKKKNRAQRHIAAQDDWQFAIPFYPDDIMLEARYNYRFYFPLPLSNPPSFPHISLPPSFLTPPAPLWPGRQTPPPGSLCVLAWD